MVERGRSAQKAPKTALDVAFGPKVNMDGLVELAMLHATTLTSLPLSQLSGEKVPSWKRLSDLAQTPADDVVGAGESHMLPSAFDTVVDGTNQ